jgi:hypothetical protein
MAPTPGPSIGDAFAWAFWFLGEVAFKWIPGTAVTIAGTGTPPPPGTPPAPTLMPIQNPVTVPQVVDYLQTASAPGVYDSLFHNWSVFVAVSLFVSLLMGALVIYCIIRIQQIRYHERRKFEAAAHTVVAHDIPQTHLRWNRIVEQARGESEQGRRLAILEADIMLNELLDTLGLKGETIADKMKRADRVSFRTIDLAWEAHKIRNKIAHEGAGWHLSEEETQRVIALYERVFREFHFVE